MDKYVCPYTIIHDVRRWKRRWLLGMDEEEFKRVLAVGESSNVEFKRCGNKPERDTFETICSFANHSGGSIFLGVENDGAVSGIEGAVRVDIARNITNVVNDPNQFKPPVSLEFESIDYGEKKVLRTWVPLDSEVHQYKRVIYDRSGDADIRLTTDHQIANLYLRKQKTFTESKIYKAVAKEDLELDLLEEVRRRANVKHPDHPWVELNDDELLQSANLFVKDYETGARGFNLAAVLLFGKEQVIRSILPAYKTDALVRVDDVDRFDDRLEVKVNLLRAYPLLEEFCKRNMQDRFFLDKGQAVSPRDVIVRELISNTLIHREYVSPYPARILIDGGSISTENGSRPAFEGPLNLRAFNPMPKNPIIGSFFNTIGWADELGSGAKNLLKYAGAYSDEMPSLIEGPVFRASVALRPSPNASRVDRKVSEKVTALINEQGYVTTVNIRDSLGLEHKTAQRELNKLVERGLLKAVGRTRGRRYIRNKE